MPSLFDFNDMYHHDLPEQRSVLLGIITAATRPEEAPLVASALDALQQVEDATDLEQQRTVSRTVSPKTRSARSQAVEAERLVRAIGATLRQIAALPVHPCSADAGEMLRLALPKGVIAYNQANRDERQVMAGNVIDALGQPEWAEALKTLGLTSLVERLASLNPEVAIGLLTTSGVSSEEVEEARAMAGEMTRRVVYQVLGAFDARDRGQVQRREAILSELRAVQGRLKARFAVASAPKVVCPPTGLAVAAK